MEELGFNFEVQSEKNEARIWNEKFQRLKKYKCEHGDCLVPIKDASNNHVEDEELSIWVQQQRTNYKCATVPDHRLQKLEEIGFVWSIVEGSEQQQQQQQLMFEVTGDEIDLSAPEYAIGDVGCIVLCNSLTNNNAAPTLCMLDLEANGLSWVGGSELAAALRGGAAPGLTHLNIGCNSIGGKGAAALADALSCCPLLLSLDLHGNAIGDDGCVAIGVALAAGAVPSLDLLDLSANRIEDRGCAALSPLFGVGVARVDGSCCPLLTHLNLRENGIESIAALFGEEVATAATLPLLTLLDLSWNCIADFGALSEALAFRGSSSMCPSLLEFCLKGNSLSDAGCARLCAALRASGATPLLIFEAALAVEQRGVDGPPSGGDGGEGRLRRCLRLLADGDETNSRVCRLALWESSAVWDGAKQAWVDQEQGLQQEEFGSADETGGSAEMRLPFELLRRDGFVVWPPLAPAQDMTRLAAIMERLESAGWPPVFCFMSDSVWDFVAAQVWPVVRALLGVDCVLDSGSAFAWSLKATGKSTFPRDGEFRSWQNAVSSINTTVPKEKEQEGHRGFGSSFGLPHRDYSAADSLYREEEGKECPKDAASDHPAILNVWIPLNDATLDNGCLYVVPREFDIDFARTDGHHAHMNPATEVQRGVSSKIHFPLHGVRALPAPAGSLIAWYGNTIHWGSTCSRYAKAPRKSIALTFRRGDIKVGAQGVLAPDDDARRVHRPSPPITITQACDMTPALRLALISRSLLLYNQWHALADDAVPPLIFETTAVPEKRQRPV
jgi:hypothetical protein